MYYIYEIRNQVYKKYYIGMTFDYNKRFSQHKTMLRVGKHPCKEMQKDYNYLINKKFWNNNCNFLRYSILAEHENKEIAKGLETLFIYKYVAHRKSVYNKNQNYFPDFLIKKNDKYINSFVDNITFLYAFFHREFADDKFKKLCTLLNKEYLIKIVLEQ